VRTLGTGPAGHPPPAGLREPDIDSTERRLRRLMLLLPYLLLGLASVLSLAQPAQTGRDRLTTVALVAAAAAWALAMYTLRTPAWRRRTGPMLVYTAGQLVLASMLMAHQPLFFVFAVIGFVQAYELLPTVWAVLAIAATSTLVNLIPGGLPTTEEWATGIATIIGIQTALIGWFGHQGRKLTEESERRRQVVDKLEAALAENAALHAQLLVQAREAGVHDERQRLAGEIHDTLAQGLTGIITQLQAADRSRADPQQWQRHIDNVHALARDSLTAARRSVAALRPAELDGLHLPTALADLAERWSRTSHVAVQVETTGEPSPLSAEIEITLFRVAQEALANVAKHARATKVGVTLSYLDDVVLLDVRDDGVGFALDEVRPPGAGGDGGYGLNAMRQRLDRIGGSLEIESVAGDGTAINASVPTLPTEATHD
jgi:signal transduction histidine kinase